MLHTSDIFTGVYRERERERERERDDAHTEKQTKKLYIIRQKIGYYTTKKLESVKHAFRYKKKNI